MRSFWSGLTLALAVLAVGCDHDNELAASFQSDLPTGSVSMAEGSRSGDVVTVAINVTAVDNVSGASFQVLYDEAQWQFVNSQPGTLLESGGRSATYSVVVVADGVLEVGAARLGGPPGVDVGSTLPLIRLRFKALAAGSASVDFDADPDLLDDQGPPQEIPGLTWTGGTVVAE